LLLGFWNDTSVLRDLEILVRHFFGSVHPNVYLSHGLQEENVDIMRIRATRRYMPILASSW
jgi:hypothetical protein